MSLDTNIQSLATRMATEAKALRTLINGNAADLSALTTTAKGSLVAAINEVKASVASGGSAATTSAAGIIQIATDAEAIAGVVNNKAVVPTNVAAVLTNLIDTNVALGTSNTKVASQGAVKAYADALIGANDAMVFKGVIDASASPNYPASNRGDTYRISVAGKIGGASGTNVEVGDLLIALTDGTAAGTQAAVGAQWNVTQANIDGAVVGPASATAGDFATFSGTTGKVIAGGTSLDTDGAMTANSNTRVPSQAAVVTYAYSKAAVGPVTTDYVALFNAGLV